MPYFVGMCIHWLIFTPAPKPLWADLISFDKKDGSGTIRIIDFICTHPLTKCEDLAHVLLRDRPKVNGILEDMKDKEPFVRRVLDKWISTANGPAVPVTWGTLVESMKGADLDGATVNEIQKNVC